MDNKNELQEFSLDDILKEFGETPEAEPEVPAEEPAAQPQAGEPKPEEEAPQEEEPQEEAPQEEAPQEEAPREEAPREEAPAEEPKVGDTIRMEQIIKEVRAQEEAVSQDATIRMEPPQVGDTIRMEQIIREVRAQEEAVSQDATIRMDPAEPEAAPVEEKQEAPAAPIIELNPRARLRELKRKLVAGPEKRYYELTEYGVIRLQIAILVTLLLLIGCGAVTAMYSMGLVPENRLRLVIFSQVLAMLISAALGSNQMLDGLAELLRGRFTINTLLSITFIACCADAVFCLKELRIPFCAAFTLQTAMALWARYQRRTTEMAQMDTLRKAVRLHALVKEPEVYDGKAGILRTHGDVDHFMDNYDAPSGPEKLSNGYAFVSLFACIGIAVFAGVLHGVSMGVQVLSTSLLVAVPASFYVCFSRPMAILEKRLHMVGTVICGWQGVKGLCGKAVFPLKDEDIFPNGSTKLNGVKFYGDRDPDQVVSYATSLIAVSGSGLAPIFRQMLAGRDGSEYAVENFQNYGDGGIGGEVNGEPVLLGGLNFLQDMGVEIPEGTMVNQAVYAAIDGQLSAVFAISYAKMRSAAGGLVALCGYRKLKCVITGGDFMLTDGLLRSKFKVNTRRIEFPDREVRKTLRERQPDANATGLAFATRDELVSYAYAITGSRALRTSYRLGVALHLLGGVLGLLIMLCLSYLGAMELLSPTHILLYQLVWAVPGLLFTEWTRTV